MKKKEKIFNGLHARPQAANAQRRTLESEVKIRTSAMESFDQMNSSLITANLSLQVTNSTHVTHSGVWL